METITITKRQIGGKDVYNKRFDDYENSYFGQRISRKEYEASKAANHALHVDECKALHVVERITYQN